MNEVTVWYLESHSPTDLKPAADPGIVEISEARVKQFQFNRFLYELVGAPTATSHDSTQETRSPR